MKRFLTVRISATFVGSTNHKHTKYEKKELLSGNSFFYVVMLRIKVDFHININIRKEGHVVSERKSGLLHSDNTSLFSHYVEKQTVRLRQLGRYSTARNYQTALRSFLDFCGHRQISFSDFNSTLVADYERWLKNKVTLNTVSCYLRSLRAVYNKAVTEGLVVDKSPFSRSYTGYPKTEKRSVGIADIRKLSKLPLKQGTFACLVRDIFLFCIFACGMPFVDVAFLRKSQISDGYLTYHRKKTHQKIRIRLLPCAQSIINRYRSSDSDYVFPFLTRTDPEEAYKQYKEKLSYYNKVLKDIGKQAGIARKLTSYVSRHSWASLAYEQNTDVSVISKGLGHTSANTTYIYIKGIDDVRLDDANRKIVGKILRAKEE